MKTRKITQSVTITQSIVQITRAYTEELIVTPTIAVKALFLKLTRSYKPSGMTPDKLYEATRREWRLNQSRLEQIEYVFAIYDNTIVEVYKPIEWYVHTKNGRSMFEGILAPIDVRKAYIGMTVPELYGVRNPVIYNF